MLLIMRVLGFLLENHELKYGMLEQVKPCSADGPTDVGSIDGQAWTLHF